jgi:hypothetical protein
MRLSKADPGHLVVAHGDEQVLRVQHLVVLEVVQQRVGRDARLGRQEHRRARHPQRRADEDRFQEAGQVDGVVAQRVGHQLAALLPGQHQREHADADDQGNQPPSTSLSRLAGEEGDVDDEEEAGGQHAQPQR